MKQSYNSRISESYYSDLELYFKNSDNIYELFYNIVNAPFDNKLLSTTIDLGIVVLLQVDNKSKTINRVALSDTILARNAAKASVVKFNEIKIPLSEKTNIISQAISSNKYKITDDWAYMFNPVLTSRQARLNQASASIDCSVVFPLSSGDGGALIFSFYQPQIGIGDEHTKFIEAYGRIVDRVLKSFQSD